MAAMQPFEIREVEITLAPEICFTSEVRYCRTETVSRALNTTPLSPDVWAVTRNNGPAFSTLAPA